MRRVWAGAATCIALAACANILGIDDGTPRDYDGSIEGGQDAAADAAKDVVVDVPFSPLSCGASTTCNFAIGQACCRTDASAYLCVSSAAACTGGTYIPCD